MTDRSVFIGFDPREADAFAVCRHSIRSRFDGPVHGLDLEELRDRGLYTRQTERRAGRLWDTVSGAHMATEFAISRFLVPYLAKERGYTGWALFVDCDFLFLESVDHLFDLCDDRYAVMCVQHEYAASVEKKMDGQENTTYPRKNWSSLMLFNLEHPSNHNLTVDLVNTVPGRELHRFCWLDDDEIGELPAGWNWLVGEYPPIGEPKAIHYTLGVPSMQGYEQSDYAKVYWRELRSWARGS